MTREEAYTRIRESHMDAENPLLELSTCVDKIYDDFESRTCKGCKYFKDNADTNAWCTNEELNEQIDPDEVVNEWFIPAIGFCCSKWEKKND